MVFLWMVGLAGESYAQSPPPASEESRLAQARELYRLGAGLYKAGRYREAIVSFQEAYELSDNKKILYNIANAQERLGDLQGAIQSLREYRPHATPSDVVSLDLRISAIEDRLAAQPTPVPAAPAPATAPAATQAVPAPAPVPVPAPEPVTRTKRQPRWALVSTGAVAGLGFGAAALVTYLDGQTDQDEFDETSYQTNRTINNIAVPLAGVGAGVAALGFIFPQQKTVIVAANPMGATVRLRF